MTSEVIIETPRLKLVMWQRDDAELVHTLHSTVETTRYLGDGKVWSLGQSQVRLANWFEEHSRDGTTKYKLIARDDSRFLGRAGFSLFGGDRPDLELGYSLRQEEWGKGYATEIGYALRKWFFAKNLGSRFIGFTHPENVVSQRVLKKIGMRCRTPMIVDGRECPTFEFTADMRT